MKISPIFHAEYAFIGTKVAEIINNPVSEGSLK